MSLTYAGVPLGVPTAEIPAWIAARLPQDDYDHFAYQRWPGRRLTYLSYANRDLGGPSRINALWWPRDASRWAVFRGICSTRQLTEIRQACYGASYRAQPLVLSQDGPTGTEVARVTASMWMLPPRPLSDIPNENCLWLVTLVDERYFWWHRSTGTLSITEGTTTWAQLYAALASAVSATLTAEAVNAAYLKPTSVYASQYEPTPLLLDSVAYNVGQRFVRQLDGTHETLGPVVSKQRVADNLMTVRRLLAGGTVRLDPLQPDSDTAGQLPSAVQLVFPRTDSGMPVTTLYAVTKTLASLNLADLPPATTTHSATKTFRCSAVAAFSGGATPTNDAELQALAAQFATDWYRHAVAPLAVKYVGIVPWRLEGLHDAVEWTYTQDEVATRIYRGPVNDAHTEIHVSGTAGSITVVTDPHNLLSTTHPDTVPSSPARGSIIRGNATPAWERYPLGANNDYLGSDGSDVLYRTPSGGGLVLGTGRQILTSGTALSGGGDLSANRTLSLSQSPAGAASVVGVTRAVNTQFSLTGGGDLSAERTLNLVNDVASPGNSKYYGTNGSGTRGFYDIGSGDGMNALLDGVNHTDTLAGTVVLGDTIHGNSTPKWARLAGTVSARRHHLTQTGTGTISAAPAWVPAFRVLHNDTTQYSNPAGETDYSTYTLPGGTLATNGDGIRFEVGGTHSLLNSGRLRVRFDGDIVFDSGIFANDADAKMWSLHGRIVRTSSTEIKASFIWTSTVDALRAWAWYATVTATLSGDVEIKTTGDDIGTGDGITQEMFQLTFEPVD